jgi:uncharacterized membrane protein YgdD (TMEM256/DUF423 family)
MNFGRIGGASAFVGVALGAFGAHALRARLTPDLLAVFETGARYQLVHALALIGVWLASVRAPGRALSAAGTLFLAGTILFSGSLYALALTATRAWGMVTPLGGLCFLAGWIAFAIGARGGLRG